MRLPAAVRRSLLLPQCRRYTSPATSPRSPGPLNILFCGSDDFSITSLRALAQAKQNAPALIDSIHVVHRPAKATGRGLKTLREVPIKQVASEELQLPTHVIDTFTGWTPPISISLVIAVSFGLFVPPRILNYAQYGGLNVHPSLLPDLRGPAPIEHAILKGYNHTGVSVQTLHPKYFDQGTILAQSPAPGICMGSNPSAEALKTQLATLGAEMLVHVIKSGRYLPPLQDVGWYAKEGGNAMHHAPKITKQNRFIDFHMADLSEVMATHAALGDCWCLLPNGERLIIHKLALREDHSSSEHTHPPGIWHKDGCKFPIITTTDGHQLFILESTYSGGKRGGGNTKLLALLQKDGLK